MILYSRARTKDDKVQNKILKNTYMKNWELKSNGSNMLQSKWKLMKEYAK